MQKLIPIVLLFVAASCATPKMVSYSHKRITAEGCEVGYSALKKGGELFIVTQLTSDRLVFADSPLLKIRTFKGEVLELSGVALASRTEHGAVLSGTVVVPYSTQRAMAQFKISNSQAAALADGIQKIQLTTVPIVHEKTFRRDKIGKKLHEMLTSASDEF